MNWKNVEITGVVMKFEKKGMHENKGKCYENHE
jgi:hypothetical protein